MNRRTVFLNILLIILLNQFAFLQSDSIVVENEVKLNFPDSLIFKLHIDSDVEIEKATLFYWSEGRSCQSGIAHKDMDFDPATDLELEWEWEFHRDSTIPPGVVIGWQWEITDILGHVTITDPKELDMQDQRHEWQEISEGGVTVQWYVGEKSFGEDVHRIALNSLEHVTNILGIEVEDDIRIIVYPSSDEVREAVKFTADWVGGVAFSNHKTMIIAGLPGQDEWLDVVITHEMTHLLMDMQTFNCLGNWLPRWFKEGMAEYAEGELMEPDLDLIREAYQEGNLPSLRLLVSSFSQDPAEAHLHYLVSNSVVDYLIQEYGSEKMGKLLNQIGAGLMIDPALEKIYGFDTYGLDSAWRKSFGFKAGLEINSEEPQVQTATPIPTLALYSSVVQATATATAAPTVKPEITPTPKPSPTSTSTPEVLPIENPDSSQENPKTNLGLIIPGFLFLTSVMAGLFIFFRRRI
jgi:hypothetical protein